MTTFAKVKLKGAGIDFPINIEKMELGELKDLARKFGFSNKKDELIGLKPQNITIKSGENIIPDSYEAYEDIIQVGGEVDGGKLIANIIGIGGGKNSCEINASWAYCQSGDLADVSGDVIARNLRAEDTTLKGKIFIFDSANITNTASTGELDIGGNLIAKGNNLLSKDSVTKVFGDATLEGQSISEGKIDAKALYVKDNAKLAEGSETEVGGNAFFYNQSEAAGELRANYLNVSDNAKILDTAEVYAKIANFDKNAQVAGYFEGKINHMSRKVVIADTARFSKAALKSMPVTRRVPYVYNGIKSMTV